MSGIIKGYSYDIFKSFHQRDNRVERWLFEFISPAKPFHVVTGIIAVIILLGFSSVVYAQQGMNNPVADIREVMSEHSRIAAESLWPGFNIKEIMFSGEDGAT